MRLLGYGVIGYWVMSVLGLNNSQICKVLNIIDCLRFIFLVKFLLSYTLLSYYDTMFLSQKFQVYGIITLKYIGYIFLQMHSLFIKIV